MNRKQFVVNTPLGSAFIVTVRGKKIPAEKQMTNIGHMIRDIGSHENRQRFREIITNEFRQAGFEVIITEHEVLR